MSVLFDLPDDLSRSVISEWLMVESLVTLDVAVSSQLWRCQFLQILRSLLNFSNEDLQLEFLEWAVVRNIPIHELVLNEDMFKSDWLAVHPIQWNNVSLLHVPSHIDNTHANTSINACSSLTSLTFSVVNLNISSYVSVLQNLIKVDISHCTPERIDSLEAIAEHCHKLKCFKCKSDSTSFTACKPFLLKILQMNPQLEELMMEVDQEVMECLEGFKSLSNINIFGEVDLYSTARLWKKCNSVFISTIGTGFDCCLDREYESLLLCSELVHITGWDDLLKDLPPIKSVTLRSTSGGDLNVFLPYVKRNSRLFELTIDGDSTIPQELVKSIVNSCIDTLRVMTVNNKGYSCMSANLPESNRLEQITLNHRRVDWKSVLSNFHYLNSFCMADSIHLKEVGVLVAAVQKYKHCVTGQPLIFRGTFSFPNVQRGWLLEFDGKVFSGPLWEHYQSVYGMYRLKDDKEDQLVERMQREIDELKAKVMRLEGRLSVYEKV